MGCAIPQEFERNTICMGSDFSLPISGNKGAEHPRISYNLQLIGLLDVGLLVVLKVSQLRSYASKALTDRASSPWFLSLHVVASLFFHYALCITFMIENGNLKLRRSI